MIHDYYLSKAEKFTDKELGIHKKEVQNKLKMDKNRDEFYPRFEDLKHLPENSVFIKIRFTLKKPYMSKDEGEFHIIDGKSFENPIIRDKFNGLPMVRPSTWKGHLRFAARNVDWDKEEKKKIINRLFGPDSEEDFGLKGRLYFFPSFFKEEDVKKDVITPLERDTRTPVKGRSPIHIEIIKPGSEGEFHLLYILYPRGENFKEDEIEEDLNFLVEALKLMFYTYGFSAKKTSGFGVIKKLTKDDIVVKPDEKRGIFSRLCTEDNSDVNDGVLK